MQYQIITSDDELNEFCQQSSEKSYIAVDTEFVRTRTWFPHCGLIQICNGDRTVLIDPLEIHDWSAMRALMSQETVTKVLHSCSEDLEVFLHQLGLVPYPIFDTQFAACMAGMGNTLGYGKLIQELLGIELDKGESRTDWLKRPLSDTQLVYAANDVIYLHQAFPILAQKCRELGRYDWVVEDTRQLALKKQNELPAEYRYLAVKNNWQLAPHSLAVLQRLAGWRYRMAKEKDMAANFVVKETALLEIAKRLPRSIARLQALNCLTGKEIRLYGESLLHAVAQVDGQDPSGFPDRVKRLMDFSAYKKVSQSLRSDCAKVAESNQLPIEILASKKQINQYLKWRWFEVEECKLQGMEPDLCSGWRKPLLASILANYH